MNPRIAVLLAATLATGCYLLWPSGAIPYCDTWDGRKVCYSVQDADGQPVAGVIVRCGMVGPRAEAASNEEGRVCLSNWNPIDSFFMRNPPQCGRSCGAMATDPFGRFANFDLDWETRVFTAASAE